MFSLHFYFFYLCLFKKLERNEGFKIRTLKSFKVKSLLTKVSFLVFAMGGFAVIESFSSCSFASATISSDLEESVKKEVEKEYEQITAKFKAAIFCLLCLTHDKTVYFDKMALLKEVIRDSKKGAEFYKNDVLNLIECSFFDSFTLDNKKELLDKAYSSFVEINNYFTDRYKKYKPKNLNDDVDTDFEDCEAKPACATTNRGLMQDLWIFYQTLSVNELMSLREDKLNRLNKDVVEQLKTFMTLSIDLAGAPSDTTVWGLYREEIERLLSGEAQFI